MTSPPDFERSLGSINRTVRSFGRFRRRWRLLDGMARFTMASLGALLAWFALDWLLAGTMLELTPWPLILLFAAAAVVVVCSAARRLVKPWLAKVDPEREAIVLETLHGKLDNSVIGSMQLGAEVQKAESPGYAAGLVHALIEFTAQKLSTIRTRALIDLTQVRKRLAGAGAVVLIALLCMVFAAEAVHERARRLHDAWGAVLDTLFPVTMEVSPKNTAIVRGRPVELSVLVKGARRKEVRLLITELAEETEQNLLPGQAPQTVQQVLSLHDQRSAWLLDEAEQSFEYQFEYGNRYSEPYQVTVEDLPEIRAINYELTPPIYTGQPMRMVTGRVSRLQELSGTTVLISFAANTELQPEGCHVEWENGAMQSIDISGRFGSFTFMITQRDRAWVHLTGYLGKGFEMAEPLSFEVVVQKDKSPTIQILLREMEVDMTPQDLARFAVPWIAADDFGVQEARLNFVIEPINELLGRGRREGGLSHRVDPPRERVKGRFESLFAGVQPPPAPGDMITIRLTAEDNNTMAANPGIGRSGEVKILVHERGLGGVFTQAQVGFAGRRESALLLAQIDQYRRATDLLQEPVKTDRTEAPLEIKRHVLKANPGQRTVSDDEVGLYLELLSGAR